MDKPTTKDVARFFDYVQITKHCWLWVGANDKRGYGLFRFNRKTLRTHRFSYALFVGPTEPGKQILHRRECGNRNCVNPHHLYQGSHADNMRDRKLWGKGYLGEAGGNSKLSDVDVLKIRQIHKDKGCGYAEIAKSFGVTQGTIGYVVRGQTWKHLLT